MQEGQLLMTQTDRDRLVTLKKAKKKLITQRQAAEELDLSVRQVKRLRAEETRGQDRGPRTARQAVQPANRGKPGESGRRDPVDAHIPRIRTYAGRGIPAEKAWD